MVMQGYATEMKNIEEDWVFRKGIVGENYKYLHLFIINNVNNYTLIFFSFEASRL